MMTLFLAMTFFLSVCFGPHASANSFESQQWGLENSGRPQRIELDPITVYEVQGRKAQDIQAPATALSKKKVLVAVLDTGVDVNHPDLKSVLRRNEKECQALEKYKSCLNSASTEDESLACNMKWLDLNNPEVDLDKNGYPLDCNGWSVLPNVIGPSGILGGPLVDDEAGHGTHVAGIIGAAFNKVGVRGVSPNVEILPVKVIGGSPKEPIKPLQASGILDPKDEGKPLKPKSFLGDLLARGMIYAINQGAQVINLSLGWADTADSEFFRETVKLAQSRGIFVVAAAGNDSTRALIRPCSYEGVICVGAHGPDGSLSHFSNYGSGVDLAAPGTNILSTYPTAIRALRFRATSGYEFIHGTSQASPFVAGAIAEMIARGVPKDEIYPRLIQGSRPLQEKLPLLSGAPQDLQIDKDSMKDVTEKKWILSGSMDLKSSLNLTLQPLVIPVKKEREEITWDSNNKSLKFIVTLKNWTQDITQENFKLTAFFKKNSSQSIVPAVRSLTPLSESAGPWKKGELREFEVLAEITDDIPSKTRISSDLDLVLTTQVISSTGTTKRDFVQEFELVTPLASAKAEIIPLNAKFSSRATWIPFDRILDNKTKTDYLVTEEEDGIFKAHLVSQKNNGAYENLGTIEKEFDETTEKVIVQNLSRVLDQLTNKTFLAVSLIKTQDTGEGAIPVELTLYQRDLEFNEIETFIIDGTKTALPKNIYWLNVANVLRPTWFGLGFDFQKKWNLIDLWNKDNLKEQPQARLYYFDREQKLQGIAHWQDQSIVDILNQSPEDTSRGILTLLTAVKQGSSIVASYVSDFRVFKISNLKSLQEVKLSQFEKGGPVYRNFKATEPDSVLSLSAGPITSVGNAWVNRSSKRSLQMTIAQLTNQGLRRYDQKLIAARGSVDSPLAMQSAYLGDNKAEAMVLTNSELQHHDLVTGKVIAKSLERYSFFGNGLIKVHFPIVVADSRSKTKLPGIYIPDGIGIVNNLKIRTILRDSKGHASEIVTPARFRIKPENQCLSIKGIAQDSKGNPALDFICKDKIHRVPLVL